ncbi:MAG: phospholipid carrier-dependent glycosyltransferase [Planctomycetota bacterium]|nr:phospholipid carrier-dependent glycosyltransferase [Planctomycetota bacterium]
MTTVEQTYAPSKRAPLWLLWTGSWLLFLCFAHGNLETRDAAITMNASRALWLRGDAGLLKPEDGGEWLAEQLIASHIAANSGIEYGKTGKDGVHQYVWFPYGHVWLMVPFVAMGETLQGWWPEVEERYREHKLAVVGDGSPMLYAEGQFAFDQGLVAMGLPALFGATSVLMLFLLARVLGCSERRALLCAGVIALATQCFPLTRETLSDGPGLAFLLAALLAVVRVHLGDTSTKTLLLGGVAAGCAVLTRYQHAFPLLAMLVVVGMAARRERRWSMLLWFAAGGAPFAVLLFSTNLARFGSLMDTGYPSADSWFTYPVYLGITKLLIAAGKGILWFSPILLLMLPVALKRRNVPHLRWLAWILFAIPMLMFGATSGWQSGQCWGARYVTAGVVVFLALTLPQAQPWARWPRMFWLLVVAGLVVSLTSLLAPTRGYNQLAGAAVRVMYEQQFERGEIGEEDLAALDEPQHYFFLPQFSPLHANWTYAWQVCSGRFEDDQGLPRLAPEDTLEPLFGITSEDRGRSVAPVHWEDRGFRHLWFVMWGALLSVPWWLLFLLPALPAFALLRAFWRRLSRD